MYDSNGVLRKSLFQSTHPVRGATAVLVPKLIFPKISIHAPREGCDTNTNNEQRDNAVFQSTHPVRGATGNLAENYTASQISIHAPREGCD